MSDVKWTRIVIHDKLKPGDGAFGQLDISGRASLVYAYGQDDAEPDCPAAQTALLVCDFRIEPRGVPLTIKHPETGESLLLWAVAKSMGYPLEVGDYLFVDHTEATMRHFINNTPELLRMCELVEGATVDEVATRLLDGDVPNLARANSRHVELWDQAHRCLSAVLSAAGTLNGIEVLLHKTVDVIENVRIEFLIYKQDDKHCALRRILTTNPNGKTGWEHILITAESATSLCENQKFTIPDKLIESAKEFLAQVRKDHGCAAN